MIVEIDGVEYDVPDDATSEEIGKLTSAPAPKPTPKSESAARGALQGMSFGWGDELTGALASVLPFLAREELTPPEGQAAPQTIGERYRTARDWYRRKNAAALEDNPATYRAGEVGGSVLPIAASAGAGAAGQAPRAGSMLARVGQGAKVGAGMGAAAGAGSSGEEGAGGVALDALGGAVTGAGVGAALPVVTKVTGVEALLRKLSPKFSTAPAQPEPVPATQPNLARQALEKTVTPTSSAEMLRKEGVPLTVGQLNPRSVAGQIEEASTSLRGIGPGIQGQRDAAQREFQRVVMSKALPPGMEKVPEGANVSEVLEKMYQGFEPAYAPVKGVDVYPAIHAGGKGMPLQTRGKSIGAFDDLIGNPDFQADDATMGIARRFLDSQLGRLPDRKGALGKVPVEKVLDLRSAIRKAASQARRSQKFELADIYDAANDRVTQALESQLPAETADALRATDAQYAMYKVIEDTVSRAGDSPSGFTAGHLSAALKASMDRGRFARGGGGNLRDLSRAGREVFESVIPPTGARVLAAIPGIRDVAAGITYAANRPATPAPTNPILSQKLGDLASYLSSLQNPRAPLALPAASAEEERR